MSSTRSSRPCSSAAATWSSTPKGVCRGSARRSGRSSATEDRIAPRLDVVIPALDEERLLPRLLAALAGEDCRVVVVDGGSTDATVERARAFAGVGVLHAAPPRGVQMNCGAARGNAAALLFLHADTLPPPGVAARVAAALADPRVVGGAFDLEIEAASVAARIVGRAASWRSRVTRRPYGDQGLFVRRAVFEAIGGFAPLPVLEDLDFAHRLTRHGRIALLRPPMRVSARRWEASGYTRTTLRNAVLAACFYCGIDPRRLARWTAPVRDAVV